MGEKVFKRIVLKNAMEKIQDKKNNFERGQFALSLIDKSSKKILELGTGAGETMIEIKKRGHQIEGIDIFPNKELLEKGYKIIKHDLNKGLPYKNNSFDIIIALEVLEHLYNPFEMMKEIKRVLKPNGYAIISMPNSASVFSRIGQLYEKRRDVLDIYWHHFQPSITSINHLVKTQLQIEDTIYIASFRRLRIFNPIIKFLVKLNKNAFCGNLMIKAKKIK